MTDLYGVLFQELLYPVWESGLRRRPTLEHWKRLERTQWCSADELRALQNEELRKLLDHSFTYVPDVRSRFARAGLDRGDVRTVDDLRRLPLLTREEATQNFEARKSTAPPLAAIGKQTSGTTGMPLAFGYDRGSEYWRQAMKLRGYSWAGYRPGDKSLHFWGSSAALHPPPLAKKLKASLDHSLRREYYVDCTERSEQALEKVARLIKKLEPDVMVCYAQAGVALARHVLEKGCREWRRLRVICAAERLFPADRAVIREAFGPHVFETYGSREVMLIAAECEAHSGMHVSMENLVVEIVVRDEAGERPAKPGELGEVVVTDLHNWGAPFIRYLTGDLAVERGPGRCACGRALTVLDRVEGRTTDTLRDGEGRPVSGLFFNVLFSSLADEVRGFQVVQRRDRSIHLKMVPTERFGEAVLERVRRNTRKFIPGVELRIELIPELPVDRGGKLRVVVVEN
jgi:phenylacetate-CoA ligase